MRSINKEIDKKLPQYYQIRDRLNSGYANNQIAEVLSVVEGTIKNHMVNIYQKLDLHSRAKAVPGPGDMK